MAFFKKWFFRLLLILLSVVALLIAVENSSEVVITILTYPIPSLPLSWLIIFAFIFGFVIGSLLNVVYIARARLRTREIERQVFAAQSEIDRLKGANSK